MSGPRKGATMANGAMVNTNDSATRPRAALGEMLKNNDPASARVMSVSPVVETRCTVASRLNGDEPTLTRRVGDGTAFCSGRQPDVSVTKSWYRSHSHVFAV